MNFTVEILEPREAFGSWSQEEKKWIGAIGQLVANEADIGVSAFTLTTHRQDVVDFTTPLVRSHYRLYFKAPETSFVQWDLYFRVIMIFILMIYIN